MILARATVRAKMERPRALPLLGCRPSYFDRTAPVLRTYAANLTKMKAPVAHTASGIAFAYFISCIKCIPFPRVVTRGY